MSWSLTHGSRQGGTPSDAQWFAALERDGVIARKPAALEEPELAEHLVAIWDAFLFLSPSRPRGMEVGAIPLAEILAYLDEEQITGEWREDMKRLLRLMDSAFIEHCSKKNNETK